VRLGFAGVVGFDFTAILEMARMRGLEREAVAMILPYADAGLRLGLAKLRAERRPDDSAS
jgi:hypothetical protein